MMARPDPSDPDPTELDGMIIDPSLPNASYSYRIPEPEPEPEQDSSSDSDHQPRVSLEILQPAQNPPSNSIAHPDPDRSNSIRLAQDLNLDHSLHQQNDVDSLSLPLRPNSNLPNPQPQLQPQPQPQPHSQSKRHPSSPPLQKRARLHLDLLPISPPAINPLPSQPAQPSAPTSASNPNARSSPSNNITCPLPSTTLPTPITQLELSKSIDAALSPLKLEISRLRSRIEILEDDRLITAREITFLKGCLNKAEVAEDGSRPLSGRHSQLASSHHALIREPPPSVPAPTADIPVGPIAGSYGDAQSDASAQLGSPARGPGAGDAKHSPGVAPATVLGLPVVSAFEEPFRRASTRRKSEGTPTSSAASRAKHRKPELSRTVRATVFRLMGVSSSQSPRPQTAALPGEARFGNEKTRAYHGYTTTPCFPEYTPEVVVDPETQTKLWRWDWSKTIRQSANNTNFAKEIRSVIVREAADPVRPLHTEVPPSDWAYLDVAIDSAYTNMRRERENLLDPNKMVKKEIHRARNKKRGLKEDKFKRRKRALDELLAEPTTYKGKLAELGLELPGRPPGREAGAGWEDALDLRYMSSEDEANVHELEEPVVLVGNDKVDGALGASDKVFAICRPGWRSGEVQNLFTVLDAIKQPERAYRRVMGQSRMVEAPLGTPGWMIKDGWGSSENNNVDDHHHESGKEETADGI